MRFRSALSCSLLLSAYALASSAYAQAPAGLSSMPAAADVTQTTPPALSAPLKNGLTVARKFEGQSGLTGWLMKDTGGTYYIFWTTPDGKSLFAGALLNEQGDNLTERAQMEYEPRADLAALWPRLQHAPQVVTGNITNPKSEIYVFLDPSCPYCHMLWLALQPYQAVGLEVHWVILGFLHSDSMGKAAAILTAQDPAAALLDGQVKFTNGGAKPLENVPASLKAAVDDSYSLLQAYGFKGVPGIVYKSADGQMHARDAMPKLSELPQITGLPQQQENDPLLQQFQ